MRFGWVLVLGMAAATWVSSLAAADSTACGGRVVSQAGLSLIYVDQASATCPWAFTTEDVLLGCEGGALELLIVAAGSGVKYGLNGLAASRLKLPSVREIWADDPGMPGQKISMGPWMDVARSMCF